MSGSVGGAEKVLILVAVEGMKYEEAAVVLNIPVRRVRSRLTRTRSTLRAHLDRRPGDVGRGAA